MKKIILIILLFLITVSLFARDQEKNHLPTVLIVGAGPAGLASAIEARETGYEVTLIDKRDSYLRNRILFLDDSSIRLLEKWNTSIPQIKVIDFAEVGEKIGFVSIKNLEEGLEKRAHELGIQKISGEFVGLKNNEKTAVVLTENRKIDLPYEIMIAADGAHSHVRDALDISVHCKGPARRGFIAVTPLPSHETEIDVSPAIKRTDGFVRKIAVPSLSIIFIQQIDSKNTKPPKQLLKQVIDECSWKEEAESIGNNQAIVHGPIEVTLQQAEVFSNEQKSAILVGDAAATASFFQGKGANTALKTAKLAGNFLKELQEQNPKAYPHFTQTMKETTDNMIADSQFLFESSMD